MSDATEACWKWQRENRELMWQLEGRDRDEALFAAGFAAGQVAALEDAADEVEGRFQSGMLNVATLGQALRARAAELRETP